MRRLWHAPGVMVGAMIMASLLTRIAQQEGVDSPHFWWSLLICLVVMAVALTFRYLRERHSWSDGPRRSNPKPCSLN
jgi:acid phosphatase family membrane protein YuiD